jgi:hypothetical protein
MAGDRAAPLETRLAMLSEWTKQLYPSDHPRCALKNWSGGREQRNPQILELATQTREAYAENFCAFFSVPAMGDSVAVQTKTQHVLDLTESFAFQQVFEALRIHCNHFAQFCTIAQLL